MKVGLVAFPVTTKIMKSKAEISMRLDGVVLEEEGEGVMEEVVEVGLSVGMEE